MPLVAFVALVPFVALVAFAASAGAAPLHAQRAAPAGPAFGLSGGRYGLAGGHELAFSGHVTTLRPGRPSTEVVLSLFPRAITPWLAAAALDLGPTISIGTPRATGLLRIGASAFAVAGSEGSAARFGLHAAAGGIVWATPRSGVRGDLVLRVFLTPEGLRPGLGFELGLIELRRAE